MLGKHSPWCLPALLTAGWMAVVGAALPARAQTSRVEAITNQVSVTARGADGVRVEAWSNRVSTLRLDTATVATAEPRRLDQPARLLGGEDLSIAVTEPAAAADPVRPDTLVVVVTDEATGEREPVVLVETEANSHQFAGVLSTWYGDGPSTDGDGVLWVRAGEVLLTRSPAPATPEPLPELTARTQVGGTLLDLVPNPAVLVANGSDTAVLTATVRDDTGRPLPDGYRVVFTAEQGHFPSGDRRVEVQTRGGSGQAVTVFTAPVLAASDTVRVRASFGGYDSANLRLEVIPGAVAVRLFDQQRNTTVTAEDTSVVAEVELSGTTVSGEPVTVRVALDRNGLFLVPTIPPGNYSMRVIVTDRATGVTVLDGAGQRIDVHADGSTTPPKNVVSGTVRGRSDTDGARYAGATVALVDEAGRVVATASLDAQGRYDFEGLDPGDYTVRVNTVEGDEFTVPVAPNCQSPGGVVLNADVLIDPFGRVFDAASHRPVAGASVALRTLAGEVLPIPLLAGDGARPNINNVNPFVSTEAGQYSFLFSGRQVGTVDNPAHYLMTVTPPAGSPYQPRTLQLEVAPVAEGSLTIRMGVTSADGLQISPADSYALTADPVVIPDIATVAVNVPAFARVPVLRLTHRAQPDTVGHDSLVAFELVIGNTGNETARDVVLVDSVRAALSVVDAPGCERPVGAASLAPTDSSLLHWHLGDLAPGQVDTLHFVARAQGSCGSVPNRVWVESSSGLAFHEEVRVVLRSWATPVVTKANTTPDSLLGQLVDYEIVVPPTPGIAGDLTVVDPLPPELQPDLTHTFPAPAYNATAHALVWSVPAAADSACHFFLRGRPRADLAPGEWRVSNTAQVRYGSTEVWSNATYGRLVVPYLGVDKSVDLNSVEVGDVVGFRLVVTNHSAADSLCQVTITDDLPTGFGLVPGSARLDSAVAAPVSRRHGQVLWRLGDVPARQARVLTYLAVAGAGSPVATASAGATAAAVTPGGLPLSATASAPGLKVRGPAFASDEAILGQVWLDSNGNGLPDPSEAPLGGVVLLSADGTRVITDPRGRYALPQAGAGDHVLRLLPPSGPVSWAPASGGTRAAGDPWTRWVQVPVSGLAVADFPCVSAGPGRLATVSVPDADVAAPDPAVALAAPLPIPAAPPASVGDTAATGATAASLVPLAQATPSGPGAAGERPRAIGSVHFASGAAHLDAAAVERLTALLPLLRGAQIDSVLVTGHTDSIPIGRAPFADNQALSVARARAVEGWLVAHGTDSTRITSGGLGDALPVASNRTSRGRQANRRAEIVAVAGHVGVAPAPTGGSGGVPTAFAAPAAGATAAPLTAAAAASAPRMPSVVAGAPTSPMSAPVAAADARATGANRRNPGQVEAPKADSGAVAPVVPSSSARRPITAPVPRVRRRPPGALVWIQSPADSSVSSRDRLAVIADGLVGVPMHLSLNGQLLATQTVRADGRADFLNVPLPAGPATLAVTQTLAGARVVSDTVHVHVVGAAAKVCVEASPAQLPADSLSRAEVCVQVFDAWGLPLEDGQMVTLHLDQGSIVTPDPYPDEPGTQVPLRRGTAVVQVRSPATAGQGRLQAEVGGLTAETHLHYATPYQRLVLLGLASVQAGWRSGRSAAPGAEAAHPSSGGGYATGRAGLFAKGMVARGVLLTSSYDSRRRTEPALGQQVAPEQGYPVLGDASSVMYQAPSASRLFLRLERDRDFVQYGDLATDLGQTELNLYRRAFTGWYLGRQQRGYGLRAFGARTAQTAQVDQIPGEGISGAYYLSAVQRGAGVVAGSEHIVIQTRDRLHPDVVLAEQTQYRFVDYDIDYARGTLLFKQPVPSRALGEQPVFIVATYEADRAVQQRAVAGGRLVLGRREAWQLGGTVVGEQRVGGDYRLSGLDIRGPLAGNTVITGELSRAGVNGSGWAWKAAAEGRPRRCLGYEVSYRDVGLDFANPSSASARAGTRTARGRANWTPWRGASLTGEAFDTRDQANRESRRSASLAANAHWRRWSARSSVERTRGERAGIDRSSTIVGSGLEMAATRWLRLSAQRDQARGAQDITYRPSLNRLQARLTPTAGVDVVAEHSFADGGLIDSSCTRVGLQSRLGDQTTAYASYQLDGVAGAARNEAIVGLRHRFRPAPAVSLTAGFERLQSLRGSRANDSHAWNLAGEYLPPETFKGSARIERRQGRTLAKTVASAAGEVALTTQLSLLAKQTHLRERSFSGATATVRRDGQALAGLAWRGGATGRLTSLGKYEWRSQYLPAARSSADRTVHVGGLETVLRLDRRTEVFARYAAKIATARINGAAARTLTDLWVGSVRREWADTWDGQVDYRLLSQHTAHDRTVGAALELGRVVPGGARLALGYNLAGYHDADLAGPDYWGLGPYMKLQASITEAGVGALLDGLRSCWR